MRYLSRSTSDHAPMVISLSRMLYRMANLLSVFQQIWVDHPEFNHCVRDSWEQVVFGTRFTKLVSKLKRLKLRLKSWNKSVFRWTNHHIQELELRIEELESNLQGQFDKDTEQDLLPSKIELDTWEKREATRLSQCAKVQWLEQGDKNSHFFPYFAQTAKIGSGFRNEAS